MRQAVGFNIQLRFFFQEEILEKTKPFNIPKQLVVQAYERVKSNAGAAGVDEESLEDFAKDLKNNLYKLWNRMSSGCYLPPAVKAVPIPKKSGGTRLLGVPTVSDRIAQMVWSCALQNGRTSAAASTRINGTF